MLWLACRSRISSSCSRTSFTSLWCPCANTAVSEMEIRNIASISPAKNLRIPAAYLLHADARAYSVETTYRALWFPSHAYPSPVIYEVYMQPVLYIIGNQAVHERMGLLDTGLSGNYSQSFTDPVDVGIDRKKGVIG